MVDEVSKAKAIKKMREGMVELIELGAVNTWDCADFGQLVSRIEAHVAIAPQCVGTKLE